MTTSRAWTFWSAFASALLLGAAGCLSPGAMDTDVVSRYQQRLAERGAQVRGGEAGLGLLRPEGGVAPALNVRADANGAGTEVSLGLKDAILRAMANNPDIRVVSFDPEIARQDMIKAAAAFDAVVFGSYQVGRQDNLTSSPLVSSMQRTQTWNAGVKELTPTGGTWNVTYGLTRLWDNSPFNLLPTNWTSTVVLQVTQPLLRDAGPEFNLSRLRLAQTNQKISQADFRIQVETTVAAVVTAYWSLWEARQEVPIRRELLERARATLEKVKARAPIDAAAAEIHQSQAAVKQREILLDAAVKVAADAQDALVRLLADPQLNLVGRLQVVPADLPGQTRLALDETDQLLSALQNSPALDKARLAIVLGDINVKVARNQALPRLDFTGSGGYQGLGETAHESTEKLGTLRQFNYNIGLALEYPLGNRERLAEVRKQTLTRAKAVSQLQTAADQIGQAVKERLREIARSWHEIELDRELVEDLRLQLQALEDIETLHGRLTPEFLSLKLSTQSSLADARIAEMQATRTYNLAISDLARTTGTTLKQYSVYLSLPAATGLENWPASPPEPERPSPSTTQSGNGS